MRKKENTTCENNYKISYYNFRTFKAFDLLKVVQVPPDYCYVMNSINIYKFLKHYEARMTVFKY